MGNSQGYSILSLVIFLIALGMISMPIAVFYQKWAEHKRQVVTLERVDKVTKAIDDYAMVNGRYPCPASLEAKIDTSGFGMEVSKTTCNTGNISGTVLSNGKDGQKVRAGAVPVRVLGIGDEYSHDGFGHRLVYSISTDFTATPAPDIDNLRGAISLIDDNGNVATEGEGNLIFAVMSMGDDSRGAYERNGGPATTACEAGSRAEENCDFDATLKNSVSKSYVEGKNKFTSIVRYNSAQTCANELKLPPRKIAYLLDTSGSMRKSVGKCPPSKTLGKSGCNRMDVARWATRRAVIDRMIRTKDDPDSVTEFTGFVGETSADIRKGVKDIKSIEPVKVDTSDPKYLSLTTNRVENKINMCKTSYETPLNMHLEELANHVGSSKDSGRPHAIVIISDGDDTYRGYTPGIVKRLKKEYPNLTLNFIVTGGDKKLKSAVEASGGTYANVAGNPTAFLKTLYEVSGSCGPVSPGNDDAIDDSEEHCPSKDWD